MTETYETLQKKQDAKWQALMVERSKQIDNMNAELLKMPDVVNAPDIESIWDSKNTVFCPKHTTSLPAKFKVIKWVLLNGKKHRAELDCVHCDFKGVFDFHDMIWLVKR